MNFLFRQHHVADAALRRKRQLVHPSTGTVFAALENM
jgi:dTDP-4-dehydrorhamnose reductase